MSFVQRELELISAALLTKEHGSTEYNELYAAQQALSWSLDPDAFASPTATLNKWHGVEGGTKGTGITFTDGLPIPAN